MLLLMLKPCHWNVQEYNLLSKIIKYIPLNDKGKNKNGIGNMLTVEKNIFFLIRIYFYTKENIKISCFQNKHLQNENKSDGIKIW